jgi:hypothetical protein
VRHLIVALLTLAAGCDLQIPVPGVQLGEFSLEGREPVLVLDQESLGTSEIAPDFLPEHTGPISGLQLTALVLRVSEAGRADGDDNFGFLSHVEAYLSAEGVGRALVAQVDNQVSSDSLVLLATPNVDLIPYLDAGATLELVASGSTPPTAITFTAEANLVINLF